MRFKGVYEKGVGFNFPQLSDEKQCEIFYERTKGNFKTLITGMFENGKFFLEYSPKLNFLLITYGELKDESITKVKMYLYTDLNEALEDFKQLERKPNARWWKTSYYEKEFVQDYIEPGNYSKMKWRKKGVLWVAQGTKGKFSIRHLHRKYIGKYESREKDGFTFNMPPTPTISKMKENCKENAYWES